MAPAPTAVAPAPAGAAPGSTPDAGPPETKPAAAAPPGPPLEWTEDVRALQDAVRRNDPDATVRAARKLLAELPQDQSKLRASCYAAIARTHLLAGKPRLAAAALERALEADPSNVPALFEHVCQALLEKDTELAQKRGRALPPRLAATMTAHALVLVATAAPGHRYARERLEQGNCFDPVLARSVLAALGK